MQGMEILVLGDGAYVFAVLNAVASIKSYNILGAIGAIIGIILMAIKGVSAPNGPTLNPASFLISIVLFWIVFVPRVDRVVVQEIMVQPGNVAPRTYVVDNVPFGLAGAGFMMSQLGAQFTQIYETNFGSAEDSQRGTTGGLGRNLALLTTIQTMMADPQFTDAPKAPGQPGYIATYRGNFLRQIQKCVIPNLNYGRMSISAVMNAPGIEGVINPVTANKSINVQWQKPNGEYETVNCAEMNQRISTASSSDELLNAFNKGMEERGKTASSREIQTAFGSFTNNQAMKMQDIVATSTMMSLMTEARVRGSLSPADAQAVIMIEEAARKRNVQWAAEENLFIRILRPVVGFFEALFYALAPIIAFVITMGPFGWGLVGKYAMLTVWVGLWFPMLAITQLYSNVQMKQFFALLGKENSAGNSPWSPEQIHQIGLQSMDALGAASALAAATPALAMSLLYGGAVSMSYLAGRLQGSDMIDEKKVAPDASAVAPVASMGSGVNGSLGAGNVVNGGSMKSISAGSAAQRAEAFSEAALQSKAVDFSNTIQHAAKSDATVTDAVQNAVSSGWTKNQTDAFDRTVTQAESRGVISSEEASSLRQLSEERKQQASLSPNAFGIGGGASWGAGASETEAKNLKAAMSAATKLSNDAKASTGLSTVAAAAITNSETHTGALSKSGSVGETIARAARETTAASNSYQQTSTLTSSINSSETLTEAQLGTNFADRLGHEGASREILNMEDKLRSIGLDAELDRNLQSRQVMGGTIDPITTRLGALYDTVEHARMTGANADELAEVQETILRNGFTSAGAASGLGAHSHVESGRDLNNEVGKATAGVTGQTASAHTIEGPGFSAGAVHGQAAGMAGAIGADVQAGHAAMPSAPHHGQVDMSDTQRRMANRGNFDVTEQYDAAQTAVRFDSGSTKNMTTYAHNDAEPPPPSAPGGTGNPLDAMSAKQQQINTIRDRTDARNGHK